MARDGREWPGLGRLAWAVGLLVLLADVALTGLLPKQVGWDPGLGVLAAAQFHDGRSPSMLATVQADPADLRADQVVRVSWWAPAYQAVPLAVRARGPSWGASLRIVGAVTVAVGAVGWAAYVAGLLGTGAVGGGVWLAILLSKYLFVDAVTYQGGDQLLWTAAPWVVLLTRAAVCRPGRAAGIGLAVVAGAAAGGLFLLKYSSVGVIAGLGVGVAWRAGRSRWAGAVAWGMAAAAVLATARAAGFGGGPTPATTAVAHPSLLRGLAAVGLPLVGAFDLHPLVQAVQPHLHLSAVVPLLAATVLTAAAGGVAVRSNRATAGVDDRGRTLATLGLMAGVADTLMLAVLIGAGSNVALDGRLARTGGLLLAPVFLRAAWRAGAIGRIGRAVVATTVAVGVVVPAAYGAIMGPYNVLRAPRRADAEGVVDLRLPRSADGRQFVADLRRALPPGAVVYTVYPQLAFPIRDRRLIVRDAVELATVEQLAATRYRGVPAGGVALFVPTDFATGGKLSAVESSFVDVHHWSGPTATPAPDWSVWVGRP